MKILMCSCLSSEQVEAQPENKSPLQWGRAPLAQGMIIKISLVLREQVQGALKHPGRLNRWDHNLQSLHHRTQTHSRLCATLKFVFGEISWLEISMFGVRLGIRWCQVFTRSLSTSGSFKVKQYQLKFTWTATASVYFLCMTDILDNNYLGGNKKIWQT